MSPRCHDHIYQSVTLCSWWWLYKGGISRGISKKHLRKLLRELQKGESIWRAFLGPGEDHFILGGDEHAQPHATHPVLVALPLLGDAHPEKNISFKKIYIFSCHTTKSQVSLFPLKHIHKLFMAQQVLCIKSLAPLSCSSMNFSCNELYNLLYVILYVENRKSILIW